MAKVNIPRKLPCLSVADGVIFPGASHRIPVRAQLNINMVEECLVDVAPLKSHVICIVYKDSNEKDYNIHKIGTAAVVTQIVGINWPRPAYTLQVTGLCRLKVEEILQSKPYMVAATRQISGATIETGFESSELANNFRQNLTKFLSVVQLPKVSLAKLKDVISTASLDMVSDLTASIVEGSYETKLQILDILDVKKRVEIVQELLRKQTEKIESLNDDRDEFTIEVHPESIRSDELSKALMNLWQRKRVLNMPSSQKPVIEKSDDDERRPGDALAKKLKDAKMPPDVEKVAMEDLKKLNSMMPMMPEYAMLRNYLEFIAELPWSKETTDTLDIAKAKKDLDDDHYGLDDVKKRILEYLAVRRLKNTLKGPILCFVGPPGVGKTSIGRSVARTLGRQFHRISLGGVCDQSDIRGHRRTYVGAMPGRIVNGLKITQSKNPVFLLDEVDKMSAGVHGDPTAALLEVLDPEQNFTFVDHYLNVPFDLSQVLFIATANSVSGIPAALLDRMELVQIAGYTVEEKIRIGQRYLIPKQMKEHGLTVDHVTIPERSLRDIAHKYTREAGVRNLERKLGAIMRAVALKYAERSKDSADVIGSSSSTKNNMPDWPIVIDEIALNDILGAPLYMHETREILSVPGVAAGLAWTPVGGEIMYVETSKMDGEGKLTLTGQLGDVMQESVRIALSWLRTHAHLFGIQTNEGIDFLEKIDLHVHFPAGAISKDGPSAGVAIVTALVSLFTNKRVRSDTAMTGEITLRGLVLPVGGIKEKVMAANRAGFSRVVLPQKNERDGAGLPSEVKESLKIIYAETIEDVLKNVFESGFPKLEERTITSKL